MSALWKIGILASALAFLAQPALGVDGERWLVKDLLNQQGSTVEIRGRRTGVQTSVPRKTIVVMDEAMHRIMEAAETSANFYIIGGSSPNALAGVVRGEAVVMVNFGMIGMIGSNEDEWAALLGHEVAHLTLEHGKKTRNRNIATTAADIAVQATTNNVLSRTMSNFITNAVSSTFSREQERESDYLGAVWAVEAGYNPAGAAELHRKLLARKGGGSIPFLSSHPSSEERVATLAALADRLGQRKSKPGLPANPVLAEFAGDADSGNAEAQFRLGEAYTLGKGIEQDYIKAYKWLTLADSGGHPMAKRFLPIVKAKLSTVDHARADQLVAEWQSR